MKNRRRVLVWLQVSALILFLPIPRSFGNHMGGFAAGGHHSSFGPGMSFRGGHFFHHGDHRFFDHNHRFAHDHFFHHRHHFFFGFDFAAFGFPYGWYPYYDYPYDYAYADYSPVYDYRYWSGLATAVQNELAARGYYHGSIDGVIGPGTREAIRKFQEAERLPVTGLIDPKLLKAMRLPEVSTATL